MSLLQISALCAVGVFVFLKVRPWQWLPKRSPKVTSNALNQHIVNTTLLDVLLMCDTDEEWQALRLLADKVESEL